METLKTILNCFRIAALPEWRNRPDELAEAFKQAGANLKPGESVEFYGYTITKKLKKEDK